MNGRTLKVIIIDSHYEGRHAKSMNDQIILKLVKKLDGTEHRPENILGNGFEIYVSEPVFLEEKPYRIIWTLHPGEEYLGVVNAFRRSYAKISN